MSNTWFRLYSEFADDPKVQIMPEAMQRRLIMLFCARCHCDVLVTFRETEMAFHWRVTMEELDKTKALFIQQGFIDDEWNILNWNKRQFISDSSSDRTKRYRERQRTSQERHGDGAKPNVTAPVTAPDTDTDTDTEEQELKLSSSATTIDPKPRDFVEAWNSLCGNLPKVEAFPESRRKKVHARIKQGITLETFSEAVGCCKSKPFLRGDNDRGWTATFDWLVTNDRNIEKAIAEYGGKSNVNGKQVFVFADGTPVPKNGVL